MSLRTRPQVDCTAGAQRPDAYCAGTRRRRFLTEPNGEPCAWVYSVDANEALAVYFRTTDKNRGIPR